MAASEDYRINALLKPSGSPFDVVGSEKPIISYSFYDPSINKPPFDKSPINPSAPSVDLQKKIRDILENYIEPLINVNFVEINEEQSGYAQIRYIVSDEASPDKEFYAYQTGVGVISEIHFNSSLDGSLNYKGSGSELFVAIIHETLHALGLKHPGNYSYPNAGSNDSPPYYTSPPFLNYGEDNTTNTVMSYNQEVSQKIQNFAFWAADPMPYDILALQHLYGIGNHNAGDTTYQFSNVYGYTPYDSLSGPGFVKGDSDPSRSNFQKLTIWDSGGLDTLNFLGLEASTVGYHFDIQEGGIITRKSAYDEATYEAKGDPSGANYSTTPYGTRIAYNTTIENVIGSGSNDDIIGNSVGNVFYGAEGDDFLYGDEGNDSLFGEQHNDTLRGSYGNDSLSGGEGDDSLYGDELLEFGRSTDGNDYLNGGNGNDYLIDYDGNDSLDGGDGNDSLDGGDGNDTLIGGWGNDSLYGNGGYDSLYGGGDDDYHDGGEGNDLIAGWNGNDTLIGGWGSDSLYGNGGYDSLYGGGDDDYHDGGEGNDLIAGWNGNDTLVGGGGNDSLYGDAGYDSLNGGTGNDELIGGLNSDILVGGSGDDLLIGSNPSVVNSGAGEFDNLTGDAGADIFVLGDSYEAYYLGLASAEIYDFDWNEGDKIRVFGSASDYSLSHTHMGDDVNPTPLDTAITYKGDVIGVVDNTTDISMSRDFIFV